MLEWVLIAGLGAAIAGRRFVRPATIQPSERRERACLTMELIKQAEADALSRHAKGVVFRTYFVLPRNAAASLLRKAEQLRLLTLRILL